MQTQTETNIIPFSFQGMALRESCWIDGKPYFTRRAIGEFLGYERPRAAIHHILTRNPYILKYRTVVNLTTVEASPTVSNLETVGGQQTVVKSTTVEVGRTVSRELEVFDPIGLQCIFFESHQPKAIQYKVAAAELIWALINGDLKPSKWSLKGDLVSAARQILSLPEGRKRRALVVDLAAREGCTATNAYRRIFKATGERLKTKSGKPRRTRANYRSRPEYQQALNYKREHPKAMGAEIRAVLGLSVSASQINFWMREAISVH